MIIKSISAEVVKDVNPFGQMRRPAALPERDRVVGEAVSSNGELQVGSLFPYNFG